MQATLFNVFDTLGRKLGGIAAFDMRNKLVNFSSFMRIIFGPLFFLIAF
jgi:hypothetical protein